jgi:CRISP-associated protein Cas1
MFRERAESVIHNRHRLPVPTRQKDGEEWAERCAYWAEQAVAGKSKPRQKREDRRLLILSGYGVRLYIDNRALIVENGFTHHPQQREEWRFFPGEWRVPSRIVVLDGKGGLTFHALRWLAEQGVPLVHIDWKGTVVHVVGGGGAIDAKLAQTQEAARKNGRWLTLSRRLISLKIANSIETLQRAFPNSPATVDAIEKLQGVAREMKHQAPSTVDELRGVEGRAAIAYFAAWQSFPMHWKGTGRHAIPHDWRQIDGRASMVGNRKSYRNRNATHPVNAMLNYAYAVLESNVRMQVVAAGLNPTIGYFHGNYRNKHALVYDLMEPLRPLVDRGVLEFVQKQTFSPSDFVLASDGVCRLNPQLARAVVRAADLDSAVAEVRFKSSPRNHI